MTRSNLKSGEASKRTLRRCDELTQHRHVASGGSDLVQLRHEVKSLSNRPEVAIPRNRIKDGDFCPNWSCDEGKSLSSLEQNEDNEEVKASTALVE